MPSHGVSAVAAAGSRAGAGVCPALDYTAPMHPPLALCLAGVGLLAHAACAQRLNLGPSSDTPKPGDGVAALALADALDAEAKALRAPAEASYAALRRMAARLLRDGENAGDAGSEAVLAGLTLAGKRTELDTLLAAQDGATRRYIADVIAATDASLLPREVDLLLRDALAPLAPDADPSCGWWTEEDPAPGASPDALRALNDHRFLSDNADTALAQLIELCSIGQSEAAYRRSTAEWAALVAGAARALDEPPAWIDMPARDRLRADVSDHIELIFDAPDIARAGLARTDAIVDIIAATDALDSKHQTRELRDAVNRLAAAPEGDPKREPDAVRAIAETFARALSLLDAASNVPPPNELVRQVRPMLEPLTAAHRRSADNIARLLPDMLGAPDPMTEPGLLAAMNASEATAADLDLPRALTTLLTTWTGDPTRPPPPSTREPVPTQALGALANHVQQLAIATGKPASADAALAQLRDLADLATFAFDMPGERELRRGGESPEWRAVTGNQRGRIEFLLDQARTDWVRTVASDEAPAQTARLRAVAATVELLRDGADVEAMRRAFGRDRDPAINAWPGVELTGTGLDALAANLTADLAALATLTARDNDPDAVLAQAGVMRESHAAALVIARLDRLARARGSAPCTPAAELALGPPADDAAWMLPHRHALATLCRDAFEAATATGERRTLYRTHANRTASDVLVHLR